METVLYVPEIPVFLAFENGRHTHPAVPEGHVLGSITSDKILQHLLDPRVDRVQGCLSPDLYEYDVEASHV